MADIFQRLLVSIKESNTRTKEAPVEVEVCSNCFGMKFLRRDVELGDPRFGKLVPCGVCAPKPDPITHFEGLDITNDNRMAMEASISMALDPKGWLVLVGSKGTGKTTLLTCILSAWVGVTTLPLTAVGMLDLWRAGIPTGDFLPNYNRMMESKVFGIDDLAVPQAKDWAVERLTNLLDWRYLRHMPTVVTTDIDEEEMAQAFGPRLADRVFDQKTGLVNVVQVGGASYRTGRLW